MYERTPVLGRLVERVWRDATIALMQSLVTETSLTAQQLIEAVIGRIVEESSHHEILEILGEVLLVEDTIPAVKSFRDGVSPGSSPAEAVRGLVRSFLKTAVVMEAPVQSEGRVYLSDSESLKVDLDCPQIEIGREFLQLVMDRWPGLMNELGERTRDILAHTYGITAPATSAPFEPDEIADAIKIRLAFERLLWAFYLSGGFTLPATETEWTGKPVKPGEAATGKGAYKSSTARRDFLNMIMRERPEQMRSLTGNQLAALSRAYPFIGKYPWEGREPRSWAPLVRRACLSLLWGYYQSKRPRQSD